MRGPFLDFIQSQAVLMGPCTKCEGDFRQREKGDFTLSSKMEKSQVTYTDNSLRTEGRKCPKESVCWGFRTQKHNSSWLLHSCDTLGGWNRDH